MASTHGPSGSATAFSDRSAVVPQPSHVASPDDASKGFTGANVTDIGTPFTTATAASAGNTTTKHVLPQAHAEGFRSGH